MLLYINQQLNVILYTYSFKRNLNQSLELNNPSARENDFQNIKPNMQTQGLWATKEQTLFHRDKGLLYNYLWGQRSRCSHRQSKNYYWSNRVDHFHMDNSETWIWLWNGDFCKFYWWSMAGKSDILEKWLTDLISWRWKWNSGHFANSYILLWYNSLNLMIYFNKDNIWKIKVSLLSSR